MKSMPRYVLAMLLLSVWIAKAQAIVSDNYNVTGTGTGFGLNAGVNSGINPPATRITGTAASDLRYLDTGTKTNASYIISSSKLTVATNANPGRFTFSTNGTTPFDFASLLGSTTGTPQNPVVYDLSVSMANKSPGTLRCSFALGTVEGDATTWDFGFQLYRIDDTARHYVIGKRVDSTSSGLAADSNSVITNTWGGTVGTEIHFTMRVTDAGSETTTYNSRVQLSMDGGFTWFYDTDSDPDLINGWRLNGTGRYIMCDVAPDAGPVTYDNLTVAPVPVSAKPLAPLDNVTNVGAAPTLRVAVSNAQPGNVTVTYYGREAAKGLPPRDFLIPVLPDTQNYARESAGSGDATKEMWFSQTDWIANNRVAESIAYVATLGDCVQNAGSSTEWRNATNAMYRLEKSSTTKLVNGVPYGVTVGNHDQDPAGDEEGSTALYNQYFGTPHFAGKPYYGGHYHTNNDNWINLFSAGGMDFIVLSFEYGRYGDLVLDWAEAVLATNQNRRVIVLTHHAGDDNADVDATTTAHSTQGAAIYARLKTNPNFFLMLGGHVFNEGGEGRRSDTFNGKTVRTLVSDYQGRFNGGNGLMRLMYFSPSNNLVSVKTYSPHTGSYEIDANSQFTFSYNMQPNGAGTPGTPYVAIGTNTSVAPGTESSFVWSGRQANKTYDWYVKVTDAFGNSNISLESSFTTTINNAPVATNRVVTIVGDKSSPVILTASDSNGDALTFQTNSRSLYGLLTSFNPSNGSFTYSPARGFRGVDRVTFRASDSVALSSVANCDLNVVAPLDSNANGLPDSWEAQYGVTISSADADGDGQSNLAEYWANTDPTNAASLFQISNAQRQTNGTFQLTWSSIGGTRYRVQFADGSIANPFDDVIRLIDAEMDGSLYGSTNTQSFVDNFTQTGASTNGSRYYRVKVVP